MKLAKIVPRKLLNKYKRSQSRSVSRSDDLLNSFSSSGTSSSSDSSSSTSSLSNSKSVKKKLRTSKGSPPTPTSVLPPTLSSEITADEWSEISGGVYEDVKEAFKMIDKDGDGKITREELEALLSRVGAEPPSAEELNMLLSEVDRDGDGCISLEEFEAIGSAFGPPSCDSEMRDAFDFFDTDHDGRITAEELYNVFRVIGDGQCTLDECQRMISGVDKNGVGFVCFEDFSRMMMQLHR
ncbi:probable calcium-binding protein CML36 [Coffea arabica]|uniref:Probable calcium-binding protein CML36 n=1 Tax=Coffea arabica TaxID=13443 RepID=A0A6P6VDK7_COFAR|nr:probable calcium-binding protein CML36 [Coffea arabica]XP_027101044.1 probable calcium-binding protein CML36 [Coffea arabica]